MSAIETVALAGFFGSDLYSSRFRVCLTILGAPDLKSIFPSLVFFFLSVLSLIVTFLINFVKNLKISFLFALKKVFMSMFLRFISETLPHFVPFPFYADWYLLCLFAKSSNNEKWLHKNLLESFTTFLPHFYLYLQSSFRNAVKFSSIFFI